MIDLHCHILPGIDDGAADMSVALAMAEAFVADGVDVVACTPHILPGLYHNTGVGIRAAVAELQIHISRAGIPLQLTTGADVHITPDLVSGLRSGALLSLADSRYVLIEPPHHVAPVRLDETLFNLLLAGYVPIVTHPERLSWIKGDYAILQRLVERGVWMQVTSGSLAGRFGKSALYWAERMLSEGLVHILASDAHDPVRRPPDLAEGRMRASRLVGEEEATHLVMTRPAGILSNAPPDSLPRLREHGPSGLDTRARLTSRAGTDDVDDQGGATVGGVVRGFSRRLRQFLK